jgi:hypothetical protein
MGGGLQLGIISNFVRTSFKYDYNSQYNDLRGFKLHTTTILVIDGSSLLLFGSIFEK